MTHEEEMTFSQLLFDHKHLYIAFQETRHLKNFPDEDPSAVHDRFCAAADEIYQPLADALVSGQPIGDFLKTVFLASSIAQSEGKLY